MTVFFNKVSDIFSTVISMVSFLALLVLYLTVEALKWFFAWRFFPRPFVAWLSRPLAASYFFGARIFGAHRKGSISRIALMKLSIRNMQAKRTRTIITVGGMTIGIGVIVFLVSIGYGLQQLVISRVARLEEMRQFDVSPQIEGKVTIDDKTLSDMKDIVSIESAMPLISVVGRVNYNNAVSDMVAYGVTSEYLKQSAIQPVRGAIFESDVISFDRSVAPNRTEGSVDAGSIMAFNEKIRDADFSIGASAWVRVREAPQLNSKLIGYTKGIGQGGEYWGDSYDSTDGAGTAGTAEDGTELGKWMKADVLLWEEKLCDTATQGDCEGGKHMVLRDEQGEQTRSVGYFAEIGMDVSVSGDMQTTVREGYADAMHLNSDWVTLNSESDVDVSHGTVAVELATEARRQAVVNRSALKILGVEERDAVGKSFSVSFIVVGELLSSPEQKIESVPAEYVIVGVTPDEGSPSFYVPFIDLRSLGIMNYSQIKAVARDQTSLPDARKNVEAMGYVTRSVADTVAQINSLFATVRTALVVLGMMALAISALGMFNTLTVSLLERTREVGLMKAMGMKSFEVRELFLTESLIMGIFGGIFGLLSGYLLGKIVGFTLSLLSMFSGLGYIEVSFIPFTFACAIMILSFFVGFVTGIYPAKRSTRISALDALRYE